MSFPAFFEKIFDGAVCELCVEDLAPWVLELPLLRAMAAWPRVRRIGVASLARWCGSVYQESSGVWMSSVNIASTWIFPLELLRRSLLSSPSSTLGAQRQQLSKTSRRIASFLCKCFQLQNRAKKRDPRIVSYSVRCNPILDFVGSLIFSSIQRFPLLQT